MNGQYGAAVIFVDVRGGKYRGAWAWVKDLVTNAWRCVKNVAVALRSALQAAWVWIIDTAVIVWRWVGKNKSAILRVLRLLMRLFGGKYSRFADMAMCVVEFA